MTDALLARLTLGAIFIYHGLVPKLLFRDASELQLLDAHGLPHSMLVLAGLGEVLLGMLIVLLRRQRWPLYLAMAGLVVLLVDVAIFAPAVLVQAFNPLSLNLAAVVLGVIALRGRQPG
ncbi:DoxX-like family protein [Pseudomonas sp. CNPSo 3701]|uniref:DoxX-like family protein n=1 Tax=Pseudomonas sp. CNPSo 3701 TaxID=3027943 RepID=UPI002363C645|nr:DoxX-like family protein [Pseudomonas sp. CNPSo 3701]MDD1508627.1 DoxX-like family protein [Pseudomonas sp. CNPSo 3701]